MEFVFIFPMLDIWEFRKRQRKAREEQMHTKPSRYSLAALERALQDDTNRLEKFAATKDFSGENIAFLKQVEDWKEKWRSSEVEALDGKLSPCIARSLFNTAEQIFQTLVHRESSNFPVNLDDDIYLTLDRIFGGFDPAARRYLAVYKSNCPPEVTIAPFVDGIFANDGSLPGGRGYREFCEKTFGADTGRERLQTPQRKDPVNVPLLPKIPESFESGIFDKAEAAVKQMVLTNTWIR
jgi:hypothetical protein